MKNPKIKEQLPSSFRDPSGFLFNQSGKIYRQVNSVYADNYERLMNSGLFESLVSKGLLIPHTEVNGEHFPEDAYKIIEPEPLQFISYPYEWSFSMLKDAALTTLEVQKLALDHKMSLKDCSAYNIQFYRGKPVFIDTLSFEIYEEGKPWVAYRQFCQHFLAPLTLMSYKDIRLNQLFRVYIDGIPLDLASSLLPVRTRFDIPLLTHIHLHAKSQKHFADKTFKANNHKVSRLSFTGLIDNLSSAVKKLKWRAQGTEWSEYYEENSNYSRDALQHKKQIVKEFLEMTQPKIVWDLGANTGLFSRIASASGATSISFDIDPAAVEKNYLNCLSSGEKNIIPLLLDLTNPPPGIGWSNYERMSLIDRGPADTVLALALIHHLAISNNVPFDIIAEFFSRLCSWLIIEFIPKNDSQVQKLLLTREDIFTDYVKKTFEGKFSKYFVIHSSWEIVNSERTLYLMRKKRA